eukprot:6360452-Amphidinium_carterae.1
MLQTSHKMSTVFSTLVYLLACPGNHHRIISVLPMDLLSSYTRRRLHSSLRHAIRNASGEVTTRDCGIQAFDVLCKRSAYTLLQTQEATDGTGGRKPKIVKTRDGKHARFEDLPEAACLSSAIAEVFK